ncbi:hypothetical protein B0H16DRAFT_1589391, partial [Mycena metata]
LQWPKIPSLVIHPFQYSTSGLCLLTVVNPIAAEHFWVGCDTGDTAGVTGSYRTRTRKTRHPYPLPQTTAWYNRGYLKNAGAERIELRHIGFA